MYESYLQKKKEDTDIPRSEITGGESGFNEDTVHAQIAWAAGTEHFQRRDPSYHLSEEFTRNFDAIGKERAADLYQPRYGQEDQLQRFADISFKRGNLSAAIVNGTGKMMLTSCLKRTVGQEHSLQLRERKLFQMSSVHRELPARQNAMDVVNRGFADSAVGMVIDVLKDARQSLTDLEKIAHGEDQIDRFSGTDTMRKMYPFLFTDREKALIESYGEKLKDPKISEEERVLLLNARKQAEAVLNRKEQTSREFLQRLRGLRNRAEEAEKLFASDEFMDQFLRQGAAAASDGDADGKDKPDQEGSKFESDDVEIISGSGDSGETDSDTENA